jgi:hypothetical protein
MRNKELNMSNHTIPVADEAWDNRTLGAEEAYAKAADETLESKIDEAAGTQLISIRMQKSMIEDFKMIAALNGTLGYQTLMKQILQRFVDCEKKSLLRQLVEEKLEEKKNADDEAPKVKVRMRKAA